MQITTNWIYFFAAQGADPNPAKLWRNDPNQLKQTHPMISMKRVNYIILTKQVTKPTVYC